jgi:hypothetical protein
MLDFSMNIDDDSNNEEDTTFDDDDDIFTDTVNHKKKSYQVDFTTKSVEQITTMQVETINQVSTLLGIKPIPIYE